jgi:hypothetical protein
VGVQFGIGVLLGLGGTGRKWPSGGSVEQRSCQTRREGLLTHICDFKGGTFILPALKVANRPDFQPTFYGNAFLMI